MRISRLLLIALASLLIAAPMAAAQSTTGEIVIELTRDRSVLAAQVKAVSDPASPSYGHFMTFAQAVQHNGVQVSTQQAVLRYLRPRVERVRLDPTGLFLRAYINEAQAKQVFGIKAHEWSPGVLTAIGIPTIPRALRPYVISISGLVVVAGLRNPAHKAKVTTADTASARLSATYMSSLAISGGASPTRTGTPAGCAEGKAAGAFTPNQMRTAYGFGENGGKGRHIVLFESGQNFDPAIVRAYAKCFNLQTPQLRKVEVGIGGDPSEGNADEVLLDIEGVMGVLPKLSKVTVMVGHQTTPFPAILAAAIDPALTGKVPPDAVSVSYGLCETAFTKGSAAMYGGYPLWEDISGIAALIGTSVVVSSGDSGSSGCLRQQGMVGSLGATVSKSVSYPSAAQNVTAVGGTSMALTKGNAIKAQRPWNTSVYGGTAWEMVVADDAGREIAPGFPYVAIDPGAVQVEQLLGAGGGGISTIVKAPWYQASLGTSQRSVPDVAMFADERPGITALVGDTLGMAYMPIGGTSYAAPLVAASIAATNEALAATGGHRLGFLNPLLYGASSAPVAQQPFIDIAMGSNDLARIGCCKAFKGYDTATGLGTINVPALAGWASANQ